MIQRVKRFSIGEKSFTVSFPNVGQIIDVESLKQALTGGRYGVMASSGVASMYYALDIVDAIAFLQVCVPEIAKYYDIRNYTSMSPEKVQEFVSVYQNEIKPWYDGVMKSLKEAVINSEKDAADGNSEG